MTSAQRLCRDKLATYNKSSYLKKPSRNTVQYKWKYIQYKIMTIFHNVLAVLFFKKTLKIMFVLPNYAKHYASAIDKSLAESRTCSTKILFYL